MRSHPLFKHALTVLSFAVVAMASAQVDPAKLVATVNGDEIKGAEYYHRMEFLSGVGKPMGTTFIEFPPGFLTLEQIITERLVLQLAKEKGVYPTEPEVQAELRQKATNNPRLVTDWLASGKTEQDLHDQVLVELAQFKIETAGVTITDQEVSDYYKNNPGYFTIPQRYKLRTVVVTTDAGKAAVDADLAAGKAFSDVASRLSEDLTKVNGGQFGTLPENVIPEGETRTAILAAKIGETTPWLKTGNAWAKFLKESVIPAELQPLNDGLIRNIRRQLLLQRGKIKNHVAKDMSDMRAKAKINIQEKSFSDAYAKFIQAYLKEQSAKNSGGQ